LWFDHKRAGNRHAFFHAAGKFVRHFAFGAFETDAFKFVGHDAGDFFRRFQAMLSEVQADILANRQRVQQRAGLENHGEPVILRDFG
jgi:hypothetical protein